MLNYLLSALNDYVLAFNRNEGNYVFISANIYDLTGYNSDTFSNNPNRWQQITDPRDSEQVISFFRKITIGNNPALIYRIVTRQGKIKWINEKRSLFTDEATGHEILLSIIKEIPRDTETRYDRDASITGYSIMFDHNPNPMWIFDMQTLRILKINEAAIKTYEFTEEEFLGMTIRELHPASDFDSFDDFFNDNATDAAFNGIHQVGVWRHVNKSGKIIYAQITGDNIIYKDHDARIIVANNVTETIRWQEEVKKREQFLNSLIDSQTSFLIRIDMNGLFTFVNKQFLKALGYSNNDIIGRHFEITCIPEEMHLCENAFYACINNPGKVINLAHKKLDKNRKPHDTEWEFIAVTNENGEVTEIQGIGQDVTDKKDAEKEIIATKNSLEALINNTEDLIWSIDRKYRYAYMNQAYKNTIMAQSGKIPEKGDDTFGHVVYDDKTLTLWHNYYKRAFKGERYIITYESPDPATGEITYSEINFNPIYNSDGEVTGVGCFARDISDYISTNKAILDQNERLRSIASISSHELRRPVATMLGLINVIDFANFQNPDNKEVIGHLLAVGNEIDDVIRLIVDNSFTSNRPNI